MRGSAPSLPTLAAPPTWAASSLEGSRVRKSARRALMIPSADALCAFSLSLSSRLSSLSNATTLEARGWVRGGKRERGSGEVEEDWVGGGEEVLRFSRSASQGENQEVSGCEAIGQKESKRKLTSRPPSCP